MLKKILIGIIIALLVLAGIWGYFLYAGDQSIVRTWIANNPIYTIVFFVSIIGIYFLQGRNKIFKFLILIIVLINLFIIGDIFFRNNIGLNSQQFIILFGLILLALAISYIGHRIRILLMIAVGIGITFVLLTGVLPMYESLPNIDNFLQSQKTKIINQGANEGIITIENTLGSKELATKDITENTIDLSQKTQISFASKTNTNEKNIFVDIGNGAFISISPQSSITLEQSGDNTIMQIIQGNIEYYIPENMTGIVEIIGNNKGNRVEDMQQSYWSDITNYIEEKKEKFFIEELGGPLLRNPTINKIIKFFITNLHKISPKTYQNNLDNYNTIQEYLGNTGIENSEFTGESVKSMINDIRDQAKKGTEKTKFLNNLFN